MITINVPGYRIQIDDDASKAILDKVSESLNGDDSTKLAMLLHRQVRISQEIDKTMIHLAALLLARDSASEAYSKFSIPHFTETMGEKEHCIDCGKSTSWLWDYKPHCKNNGKPECFDYTKERMPLDSATKNLLEAFLDENEEK